MYAHALVWWSDRRYKKKTMDKTNKERGNLVITGASRGLGRHMAIYLSKQGFRVFAGCRNPSDLLEENGERLVPFRLDVTEEYSITAAVEMVSEAVGNNGISGLVNNAGIVVFGPVEQVPMEEIEIQMRVNVMGPILLTKKFLPLLRLARGRIVNLSSVNGFLSPPYMGIYSASKFALEALSDSLRLELKPWGIHVSVVQPGLYVSDIRAKAVESWEKYAGGLPDSEQQLYRSGFEQTSRLIQGFDQAAANPQEVSEVLLEALTSESPSARYLVGETAQQMGGMKSMTDETRDESILQLWDQGF